MSYPLWVHYLPKKIYIGKNASYVCKKERKEKKEGKVLNLSVMRYFYKKLDKYTHIPSFMQCMAYKKAEKMLNVEHLDT